MCIWKLGFPKGKRMCKYELAVALLNWRKEAYTVIIVYIAGKQSRPIKGKFKLTGIVLNIN